MDYRACSHQVFKGIYILQVARMYQAHEQVANIGAVFGFIK